jgi:3-deoxy-7-phosphoheptulonate synthase
MIKISNRFYLLIKMDENIISFDILPSPRDIGSKIPFSKKQQLFVQRSRNIIKDIISGKDSRMLVIVGPCSVHNIPSVIEYANHIKNIRNDYPNLFIVLKSYFEKPRTTVGWTGMLHQPILQQEKEKQINIDNISVNLTNGILLCRSLLSTLTDMEIPVATELVETITPQYISEYISWAAIGARTVESPVHRHLVSGVSMPVGFKNSTSGSIQVALDAIKCSKESHSFIGLSIDAEICQIVTRGNSDTHIILRGSNTGPNYEILNQSQWTDKKTGKLKDTFIMVDISHGNSNKDYRKQSDVIANISNNIKAGIIRGVMIESYILEGKQKNPVEYGKV